MLKFLLSMRPIYHIIAVTETKLDPNLDASSIVHLDNYVLLRRDRKKGVGGVALFFHNSISATILCSSDGIWTGKPGKPEYLLCEANIVGQPPCFVAVVYRPPHAPFIQGTDFIDKITTLMHDYGTKIIVGDFNVNQLCSSADAIFVRRFIEDNGLQSITYGAAYHRDTSDSWFDLCLVDKQDDVVDFWKSESPFADGHGLLTATLNLHTPKPTQHSFPYRNYNAICETTRLSASLEDSVAVLQTHVSSAIEKLAPLKTISPAKNRHPWFNIGHSTLIKELDRLYRRFRRTRIAEDLLAYRQARDLAH